MPSSLSPMPGTTTSGPPCITRLLPGCTDNAIKNHWNFTLHRRHRAFEAIAATIALASPNIGPTSIPLPLASNSINLDESNSESAGKRPYRRDEISGSEVMTVVVMALPMPPPSSWPLMEMIAIDLAMSLTLSPPGTVEGDGGREQREEFHQ